MGRPSAKRALPFHAPSRARDIVMSKSPLALVKEKFGDKDKLVAAL